MKIKIPKKLKFNLERFKTVFGFIGFALFIILTIGGAAYAINHYTYKVYAERKEADCQTFTHYLNEEVLPKTEANVTNCECHYSNQDVGSEITSNCLCSCDLYDENGTLIDDDFNPLISSTG